jgi:hypothetical protein
VDDTWKEWKENYMEGIHYGRDTWKEKCMIHVAISISPHFNRRLASHTAHISSGFDKKL